MKRHLIWIIAGLLLMPLAIQTHAAIQSWSVTASSNNSAAPDGAPEGMAPSAVNDVMREIMAQVRHWAEQDVSGTWNHDAGAANAYRINPLIQPTSYVSGAIFRFKAVNANTTLSTLQVGTLAAVTIKKITDTDLVSGDILASGIYGVVYDGTNFQLIDDPSSSVITTRGDVIRGDSSGDAERLALGAANRYLKSDGTDAAWAVLIAASDTAAGILEVAVQSEMEAASSNTRAVPPGRVHNHPGVAKGWVVFTVTGFSQAAYNVTSVDDDATGDFGVNWATNFSGVHYTVVGTAEETADFRMVKFTGKTAGATELQVVNGADTPSDPDRTHVAAFGDQ